MAITQVERDITSKILALQTAINNRNKVGNPPPYSDYHTTGAFHYANQVENYNQAATAFNTANNALTEAIKNLEASLPEPTLKALVAGEAFISRAPSTTALGPIKPDMYDYILLDKPAGKYRVIRKATNQEAMDAHKSAAS